MSNIESRKREFLNNLEIKVHRVLGGISIVLTGKPYITEPDPIDNPPPNGAPQRTKDRYKRELEAWEDDRKQDKKDFQKIIAILVGNVENSFKEHIDIDDEAKLAYYGPGSENNVKVILKHLDIWITAKRKGRASATVSEKDKFDANAEYERYHQGRGDSVAKHINAMQAIRTAREEKTGVAISEPQFCIDAILKMNKSIYGAWHTKLNDEEDEIKMIQSEHDPANGPFVREAGKGYPTTWKATKMRMESMENNFHSGKIPLGDFKIEKKDQNPKNGRKVEIADNKRKRDEEPDEIIRTQVHGDGKKKNKTRFKDVPKNAKATDHGYDLCNHENHNGQSPSKKNHLSRDCKHYQKDRKNNDDESSRSKKNYKNKKDKDDSSVASAATSTSKPLFSRAQLAQLKNLWSADEIADVVLKKAKKAKQAKEDKQEYDDVSEMSDSHVSRMMVFTALSDFDDFTILYDTCGSLSDMANKNFVRNIRNNPNKVKINTMFGSGVREKVATCPFLGEVCFCAEAGYNIWSEHECLENPLFRVTGDFKCQWVDVTIMPLNLTIRFKRANKVKAACGRRFFELTRRYEELCEERNLDFDETWRSGLNIDDLELLDTLPPIKSKGPFKSTKPTSRSSSPVKATEIDISKDLLAAIEFSLKDSNPEITKADTHLQKLKAVKWRDEQKTNNWKEPEIVRKSKSSSESMVKKASADITHKQIKHISRCSVTGNIKVDKRTLNLALKARALQRTLLIGTDLLAETFRHGNTHTATHFPLSLLKNLDNVLGKDPGILMKYKHRINKMLRVADLVKVASGEILVITDVLYDGPGVSLRIWVSDPGRYFLAQDLHGNPESGEEFEENASKAVKFYSSLTHGEKTVKLIVADSSPAVKSRKEVVEKSTDSDILQLPKGVKLALLDNGIQKAKEMMRTATYNLKHQPNGYSVGGLIKAAMYLAIFAFMNIVATSHNPNMESAHKFMTDERMNLDKVAKHPPGSIVMVNLEPETTLTGVHPMGRAIALNPDNPHIMPDRWRYLLVNNFKDPIDLKNIIYRNHAVIVPTLPEHAEAMDKLTEDKNSVFYPKKVTSGRYKSRKEKNPALPTRAPNLTDVFDAIVNDTIDTIESPPASPIIDRGVDSTLIPPSAPDKNKKGRAPLEDVEYLDAPHIDDDEPLPAVPPDPNQPDGERQSGNLADDFFSEAEPNDGPPTVGDIIYEEISRAAVRATGRGNIILPVNIRSKFIMENPKFENHKRNKKEAQFFSFKATVGLRKAFKEWPEEARLALIKEIKGLLKRKVWTGVMRPSLTKTQRKKIIRSSTIFTHKVDKQTLEQIIKARIVTDGSMQNREFYQQEDISAPTVQMNSILTLSAIAAAKGWKIKTMDVQQAYLNADMTSEVFVTLDKEVAAELCKENSEFSSFLESDGRLLVKLNKAQYGCIESAKLWYNTISQKLVSLGYKINPYDPCVFQKTDKLGTTIYVVLYVDDIKAMSESQDLLDELQFDLEETFGKMTVTDGPIHDYLGMKFDYTNQGKVSITMKKYLDGVVEESGVQGTAQSPAGENLFEISENSILLDEPNRENFHKTVAQLLYAAVRARPDILLPVIFLTTRVTKATEEDLKKLRRVLRYVNGTSDLGLILGADDDGRLRIITYGDASFGVHADGKSHSGILISLGRGGIIIKAVKQKIVTKSSTEAELVTLSDAASLTAYQMQFLESLGFPPEPALVYQDNMSTMNLAINGRSNSDRTKHIKLRYFFIKQYLDSGEFELVHCPTDLMIADVLTKPMQGDKFIRLRDLLLGITTH